MSQSKETKPEETSNEIYLLSKTISDLSNENKSLQKYIKKLQKQITEMAGKNILLYKQNIYLQGQIALVDKIMFSNNQNTKKGEDDD